MNVQEKDQRSYEKEVEAEHATWRGHRDRL